MMKNKIHIILLILLQTALLFTYMWFKNGFHMDEIWSYSLANSLNGTYFYPIGFEGKESTNLSEKWNDKSVFVDYLTVQPNERFAFSKVYDNQKKDVHPPFYYFIMHAICSIFPDTFSRWYGYSINLFFFILTQISLYALCKLFFSEKSALLICFFYGFSAAAINDFLFIRMYSMLTFDFVFSAYVFAKAISTTSQHDKINPDISLKRKFITPFLLITLAVFIGTMTQYHYLVFAFFLTVIAEIICLIKRNYKGFWCISLASLTGVLLSMAYFPEMITQLTSTPRGSEAAAGFTFANLVNQVEFWFFTIQYFFGFSQATAANICSTVNILFWCCLLIPFVLLILRYVLFKKGYAPQRNIDTKFYSFLIVVYVRFKEIWEKNSAIFIIIFTPTLFFLTIGKTINYSLMGTYASRYFFSIYPFVAIWIAMLIKQIIGLPRFKIKNITGVTAFICLVLCFFGQSFHLDFLLTDNNVRDSLRNAIKDTSCIFIAMNDELLHSFTEPLIGCNKAYVLMYGKNKLNLPLNQLSPKERNTLVSPISFDIEPSLNFLSSKLGIKYEKITMGLNHTGVGYNIYEIKP